MKLKYTVSFEKWVDKDLFPSEYTLEEIRKMEENSYTSSPYVFQDICTEDAFHISISVDIIEKKEKNEI